MGRSGTRWGALALATACVLACEAAAPAQPIEIPCAPGQRAPYPSASSYGGVHANPENNDVVDCETGSAFAIAWHALEGLAISQPNTFSPDGATTYVTTFNPDPAGCTVWALAVEDGAERWCRSVPAAGGSAVEVDADGDLYVTAERWVISLAPDGTERWRTEVGASAGGDFGDGPLGVHFTPVDASGDGGHVATVTNQGVVHLIARGDGRSLASLDVPAAYGFVPPRSLELGGGLRDLLPDEVVGDLDATFGAGASGDGLAAFLGAGGGFSDNTIGVSSRGELYVIGGGADPDHGALVQIRIAGAPGAPVLEPGWAAHTTGGSATSPSITFDGRWVSVGDGSTLDAFLNPRAASAALRVIDVDACDANVDADPDPSGCAPAWSHDLERGPIAGSPPLLPDGRLALWEISVAQGVFGAEARDLAIVGPGGVEWERALPDGLDWTSVITVSRGHLIGTASRIEAGTDRIVSVRLPRTLETWVVGVDRERGELAFRAGPIPDDASATVAIGPDGSLYAGMFGLLTILATEKHPTLGLVRLVPTAR